ncbi:SIMPL domain-containing protein [Paraferrimonas haliotis]|uniref:SIMPL domain-containing protein n=1 Tax=Paraferrimonas haliotis TaxID=2013866 RepID=A0AA37TTX1_9GAMM|nr:SIMPL domain-containing protein [Paraferrimonas haliotis]GLS82630.1 SIMPL domain-containing protein [Paraferrimonas haliotis]
MTSSKIGAFLLGGAIAIGLLGAAFIVSNGLLDIQNLQRQVTVKGLAEREVLADTAIWPISYTEAGNDLEQLVLRTERNNQIIQNLLLEIGFEPSEISLSLPTIQDNQAQGYVDPNLKFRYSALASVTLYTSQVNLLLKNRNRLLELGAKGIAISGENDYRNKLEYLFTDLNSIKPAMIEQATKNARQVALKFASDSDSQLGKIKTASQGQFSINARDSNTPHIKKIRVVSTITYYLTDN